MARSRTYNSQRASVKSQRASVDYTEVRLQKLGLSGTSDSLDEKGLAEGTWRARCFAMLAHPMFDLFISTVIVLNSIMMGVELTVQPSAESGTPQTRLFFGVMESVFLVVYIVELACRFYACGASCLRSSWVKFDVLIVTVGVIGDWLVPIILLASGEAIAKPSYLQIFRLARVGRAVRLFVQFRILWMLVSGIISSISTIVNVLIVLVLVLFAFSCLGVEVITNHAKSSQGGEFQNLVQEHWSSLPHTMLTLVQFVTLDSIGAIYAPMIREDLWLTLFFVPFILVVSIILMNLVTAVVIESFMESAKRDLEARRLVNEQRVKKLIPRLTAMFRELDVDGSGLVTLEEVESAPLELQNELESLLNGCHFPDIFEALDEDGSMEISIDEFMDGMTKITRGQTLEMTRILKLQTVIRKDLVHLRRACESQFAFPANKRQPPASVGSGFDSHPLTPVL